MSGRAAAGAVALMLAWAPPASSQTLVAAVLPSSRAVQVGTPATAFATVINTGAVTAMACAISLAANPALALHYQTTDPATNQTTGPADTPADIPPGKSQTFVFSLTANAPVPPTDVAPVFACANAGPAPVVSGLDTVLFSASATPGPDIVALAATATNDGIGDAGGPPMTGAFAVATVNVGAGAPIVASADTGSATLPIGLHLCRTDPMTGQCISAIDPGPIAIEAGATPTFAVFLGARATIPFDPANDRIFVRFTDVNGATRGATSVAVRTLPLDLGGGFINGIAWCGSQFVAGAGDTQAGGVILVSSDGVTWTWQFTSTKGVRGVACTEAQIVVVGVGGTILTSPDGRTWTPQQSGTGADLNWVTPAGAGWVAVGSGGTILTSPDAVTWSAQISGTTNDLFGVGASSARAVVAGDAGTLLTSSNGRNWTAGASGTGANLLDVKWSGTRFIVAGSGGTILTSPDGAQWTRQATGTDLGLHGVAWSGSQFAAVGADSVIVTSPDGVAWTTRFTGAASLSDIAWSGSLFAAVGEDGVILTSPDGVTWTAR